MPRLAMFILAALLAIDGFGATRDETLRVDGHLHTARWISLAESYRLNFAGGHVESCEVGRAGFDALADGDLVQVRETRVFHACRSIRRGDRIVVAPSAARWLVLLPIALLLAGALGWIEFRGDDPRGVRRPAW